MTWARKIDLGLVEDRYFVFSCGAGIDATVVKRVDKNPKLKSTAGLGTTAGRHCPGYYRNYLRNPVKIEATVGGRTETGITALAQNSDPFTYFAKQPIHVCEDIAIDDGHLAMILLACQPAGHAQRGAEAPDEEALRLQARPGHPFRRDARGGPEVGVH